MGFPPVILSLLQILHGLEQVIVFERNAARCCVVTGTEEILAVYDEVIGEKKMNIYVGNLPFGATDDDLQRLFAAYGDVSSASVIKDRFSGESRGFGFVEMPSREDAMAAIEALNGTDFQGRSITVNEAKPKTPREGGGGGGRGGRGDRRY